MMQTSPEYRSVSNCFVGVSGALAAAIVDTGPSRSYVPCEVVHHFGLEAGKQSDNRVIPGSSTATEYSHSILDV